MFKLDSEVAGSSKVRYGKLRGSKIFKMTGITNFGGWGEKSSKYERQLLPSKRCSLKF